MTNTLEPQDFSDLVMLEKYAYDEETTRVEIFKRVSGALTSPEINPAAWGEVFYHTLEAGFIPAGRILSSSGTQLKSTAINCFIQPVGDSISKVIDGKPGIYQALQQAAETMRRGGGVGYDFSAIRPKDALVQGTNSRASGPVSYMRVFDRSCETVESAGARRGAQMGVLRVDHPDIEHFIEAKDTAGELTNFNISVGVTDEFMRAVLSDDYFSLAHNAKPVAGGTTGRGADGRWVYKTIKARELWDSIMKSTYDHAEPGVLFIDRINDQNNLQYCETIEATNPCGEQPLPSYGCCCLGSIDLTKFVVNPLKLMNAASFDYESFRATVRTAVRMLDNTLDITAWPLEEQKEEATNKRRVGLGFTGLGDMLIMMGLSYNTLAARILAASISKMMRDTAYAASVELAKEKGAFPLFDAEKYLDTPFIKNLPEDIREGIAEHGIRNSHLLSIAPTGTISLAFADNASNGIEPAFSWEYTRKKRERDGSTKEYQVQDHAFRLFKHMYGDTQLPEQFVSALEISAEDHAEMMIAVQPYIDSAISKTVNVPADYPYESFKNLYTQAWEYGLKGLATYRPNEITGSVLSVTTDPVAPSLTFEGGDVDKRIVLTEVPDTTIDTLRWRDRPNIPGGNPAWTYIVECLDNTKFAMFIGHVEDRVSYPFEVWLSGSGLPRGLGALAKSLSMDMRTKDRAWLKKKLEVLMRTPDERGFELPMPDGKVKYVPGVVAAVATLIDYRVRELGAYKDLRDTPVLNTLMSATEPKTNTDGTMAWCVDVKNHATADDFVLWVKELTLPNGQRRPYSVWMAGDFPKSLVGLCKSLSLDMRVMDPAWMAAKLQGLATYHEPQADFMAWVPGCKKQRVYPSTEAYIAELLGHRYNMTGVTKELEYTAEPELEPVKEKEPLTQGKACPECGAQAVVKRDGCEFCLSCGATGACG